MLSVAHDPEKEIHCSPEDFHNAATLLVTQCPLTWSAVGERLEELVPTESPNNDRQHRIMRIARLGRKYAQEHKIPLNVTPVVLLENVASYLEADSCEDHSKLGGVLRERFLPIMEKAATKQHFR